MDNSQKPRRKIVSKPTSTDDYRVGYGKPPVETRFKPGVSGNKKGRPKGKRNHLTMLKAELDQLVTINERGKKKQISMLQASVKQVALNAVKGHLASFKELMKISALVDGLEDEQARTGITPDLSIEMMQFLTKRLLKNKKED